LTFLTNCLTIRIGNALWKQTYDDMQWRLHGKYNIYISWILSINLL
jgi:hypothetical protein